MAILYMREPVDHNSQQQYWDIYIELRCLLIELAVEGLAYGILYTWAMTYLEAMPTMQYV